MELSKQQLAKLPAEVQQVIKDQAREIANQRERNQKLVASVVAQQLGAGTMLKSEPRIDWKTTRDTGVETFYKRQFHTLFAHTIHTRETLQRGLDIIDAKEARGELPLAQLDTPLVESNRFAQDPKDEHGQKNAPTFWNDAKSLLKIEWFEDHVIRDSMTAYDRLAQDESDRYVSVGQRAINAQKTAKSA